MMVDKSLSLLKDYGPQMTIAVFCVAICLYQTDQFMTHLDTQRDAFTTELAAERLSREEITKVQWKMATTLERIQEKLGWEKTEFQSAQKQGGN